MEGCNEQLIEQTRMPKSVFDDRGLATAHEIAMASKDPV